MGIVEFNRRHFLSLLAGAAAAPLTPDLGFLEEEAIELPAPGPAVARLCREIFNNYQYGRPYYFVLQQERWRAVWRDLPHHQRYFNPARQFPHYLIQGKPVVPELWHWGHEEGRRAPAAFNWGCRRSNNHIWYFGNEREV